MCDSIFWIFVDFDSFLWVLKAVGGERNTQLADFEPEALHSIGGPDLKLYHYLPRPLSLA